MVSTIAPKTNFWWESKAKLELEISINDKANEAVKEHLEQRKKELEKYLKIIIDYLEEA